MPDESEAARLHIGLIDNLNARLPQHTPIACDGFITLGLLTVWEYHYHDKNVVAGNPAKDCFSDH